jgi:hypothetical protein
MEYYINKLEALKEVMAKRIDNMRIINCDCSNVVPKSSVVILEEEKLGLVSFSWKGMWFGLYSPEVLI